MKLILRFLRPHWKLTLLTVVLLVVEITGGLFIPTRRCSTWAPPAPPLRRYGTPG